MVKLFMKFNFLFDYYVYVQFCLRRPSPKWPIVCWAGRKILLTHFWFTVFRLHYILLCHLTGISARTARVLVLMVFPGQLIFIVVIYAIEPRSESVEITPLFAVIYITAAVIQVMI